jgi:glucosamine-6-phosphate deaminase
VGRNGHIGFNEPGSPRDSRTRVVELEAVTRADAAALFGNLAATPTRAVTLGVATILEARSLRVLAFGAAKREVVARALDGPVGPDLPASYLRAHRDCRIWLDAAAHAGRAIRAPRR